MTASKVRCSALDRALACPASTLPIDHPYSPRTPDALRGTAKHKAIEIEEKTGQPADADDLAHRYGDDAEEIRKCMVTYRALLAEVLDWLPDREPQIMVELPAEGPVCLGRLDWVAVYGTKPPEHIVVIDWKSGWGDDEHPAQLLGYASCARAEYGMPTSGQITCVEAHLRHRERIVHRYDAADLDAFEVDVRHAVEAAARKVQPGAHCKFCPRQLVCQERADYIRGATAALAKIQPGAAVTREQLGALYDRYRDVMRAARIYDKMLTDELSRGPIELPGNRRLELREVERTVVEPSAMPVLAQWFTHAELRGAVTISKSGLERAAITKAPPRGGAALMRRVMGALRGAGALRDETKTEKTIIDTEGMVRDAGE